MTHKCIFRRVCVSCGEKFSKTFEAPTQAKLNEKLNWAQISLTRCPECYKKHKEEEDAKQAMLMTPLRRYASKLVGSAPERPTFVNESWNGVMYGKIGSQYIYLGKAQVPLSEENAKQLYIYQKKKEAWDEARSQVQAGNYIIVAKKLYRKEYEACKSKKDLEIYLQKNMDEQDVEGFKKLCERYFA